MWPGMPIVLYARYRFVSQSHKLCVLVEMLLLTIGMQLTQRVSGVTVCASVN
jgi:hypothetical protein